MPPLWRASDLCELSRTARALPDLRCEIRAGIRLLGGGDDRRHHHHLRHVHPRVRRRDPPDLARRPMELVADRDIGRKPRDPLPGLSPVEDTLDGDGDELASVGGERSRGSPGLPPAETLLSLDARPLSQSNRGVSRPVSVLRMPLRSQRRLATSSSITAVAPPPIDWFRASR